MQRWGLFWGFDTLGKGGIYQTQECAEKRAGNTAVDGTHGGAWGFGEGELCWSVRRVRPPRQLQQGG